MPSTPAPGDWPPSPPPAAQAGEFTRMFQSPAPAREENQPRGGEFTRFFNAPPPETQGPPLPEASGFGATRVGEPAAPPPPRSAAPTGATQAFAIPPAAFESPAPVAQQGPSEYTRMISLASVPGGASAAPPQAPGPSHMPPMPPPPLPSIAAPSAPPIPTMAPPAFPPPAAPKFAAPQPPPVKAPAANPLLIAIAFLLGFLVGGLVVFLLMRR
jgi:hypothetical protein